MGDFARPDSTTLEILKGAALAFFGVPPEDVTVLLVDMDVVFLVRGWRVDTSGYREWLKAAVPVFMSAHVLVVNIDGPLPEKATLDATFRMGHVGGLRALVQADDRRPFFSSSGRPRG